MEGYYVLNASSKGIKKLDKGIVPVGIQAHQVSTLNLNGNNLQRLDNIEIFSSLTELTANHNQLLRMYYVAKLRNLVHLDLSNNHILSIEGLKDLRHLKLLNLSYNNIKILDNSHLQTNTQLEYLDLSHNNISHITNISHLTCLKHLFLHKNQITHLRHCELYLPVTLESLTLNNNNITDLNEISHLVQLYNLQDLSIASNSCLTMTGGSPGFDYRPFVINWCMNLKSVDGYAVDDLERLKAEWLYSQGRGRKFRIGEHSALIRYLTETCPVTCRVLESEQERKLRMILNKAQQYQKQLSQEPPLHEKAVCNKLEKISKRSSSAGSSRSIMSRSLDPSTLNKVSQTSSAMHDSEAQQLLLKEKSLSKSINCPETSSRSGTLERASGSHSQNRPKTIHAIPKCTPLPATTVMLPAPDSLVSPCNSTTSTTSFFVSSTPKTETITEVDNEIRTPRARSSEAKFADSTETDDNKYRQTQTTDKGADQKKTDYNYAATCIQKMWRGYHTRVLNKQVADIYNQLQSARFSQYIKKLSSDMEATRAALDKEHQLQVLQMEAINALWKKVASLQQQTPVEPTVHSSSSVLQSPTDKVNIKALALTCSQLDSQVQKLQNSMQEILRRVNQNNTTPNNASSSSSATASSTQTEIVAVHTPSEEQQKSQFPYKKLSPRPSTLQLASGDGSDNSEIIANGIPDDDEKDSSTITDSSAKREISDNLVNGECDSSKIVPKCD